MSLFDLTFVPYPPPWQVDNHGGTQGKGFAPGDCAPGLSGDWQGEKRQRG